MKKDDMGCADEGCCGCSGGYSGSCTGSNIPAGTSVLKAKCAKIGGGTVDSQVDLSKLYYPTGADSELAW